MKINKPGMDQTYNIEHAKIMKLENHRKLNKGHIENVTKKDVRVSFKEEIKKYRDIVKELPDVREKRVKEIKNAINQGTYKIDAKKVAKGILEDIFGVK